MYLIANASGNEITISDLGITLGIRQAVDLHKVETTIQPEQSKDLKRAKSKGAIKILHYKAPKNDNTNTIIKEKVIVQESLNKEELLRDIKGILSEEIDKKVNASQNNTQMMELLTAMQQMILNQQQTNTSTATVAQDTDVSMDKLVNIHSRTLNKMSKRTNGKLEIIEEEVTDDAISDNADELSGLL